MSELIQVRKKAQVTLPLSIRKELGIEEGDFLDVQVRDGEIVLKAKKLIDKDQAWFWTKRWQDGERQADEEIRAGLGHTFANVEEGIAFLHEAAPESMKVFLSGIRKEYGSPRRFLRFHGAEESLFERLEDALLTQN